MTITSELKALNLGQSIKYDALRQYLLGRGYLHPGKGLADLINTIKRDPHPKRIISDLKKIIELSLPHQKQKPSQAARIDKKAKKQDKKQRKAQQKLKDMDDEGDEEDHVDPIMERLKGALALRNIPTTGSTYPRLVKRLLNALDKEYPAQIATAPRTSNASNSIAMAAAQLRQMADTMDARIGM
tara:strand:- start:204 stop:758 length:555 start_codon:yes stop_codon:yes gene_type:complete